MTCASSQRCLDIVPSQGSANFNARTVLLYQFFNDNPGAIEAVHNFVFENIDCYELEDDDDDDTDEDVEDET